MDDSRRIEDAAARRAARCEFDRPVVLRAGAGTGKTAALVSRIVAWSIGPGWHKAETHFGSKPAGPDRVARRVLGRVVAITFTEAAAAEMAERVAIALHCISVGTAVVGLPADELCDQSGARAKHLLAAIDMLEVRTIHAWCRSLLARYPIEAGIHPGFTVDADGTATENIVREVVENGLRHSMQDPDNVTLLHLFAQGVSPSDIENSVATLVRYPDSVVHEFGDVFSDAQLGAYRQQIVKRVEAVTVLIHERFRGVRAPNAIKLAESLQRLAPALAAASDFASIRMTVEDGLPSNLKRHLEKAWVRGEGGKAECAAIAPIFEELSSTCAELSAILEEAAGLDPTTYVAAKSVVLPMANTARELLRARGIMGFSDLLSLTHQLLSREGVASRVRSSIDQLLVDEFQDTDTQQCGIVRAVAARGQIDVRPGLFIVGDPKQSIYGWRNADLGAYEAFVGEVLAMGGKEYRLIINFRSYGRLLEEVDRCMVRLMVEKPGIQPAYESLVANRGPGPADTCVEAWVSNPWDRGEPQMAGSAVDARKIEARAVAQEALRLWADGESLSQIGLLFRSMSDVDVYQKALRDAGVPYEVTRDQQYYRRVEIIEAAALIRAITDPTDQIALITLLRSSMVRIPDRALMLLWCEGFPKSWIELSGTEVSISNAMRTIEAALEASNISNIHAELTGWSEHLKDVTKQIGLLRGLRSECSPDAWIHMVRREFLPDVLAAAAYQGAYRVANLEQFFRRIADEITMNGGDWSALNRNLRESIQQQEDAEEARPSDNTDAVQLLTIHKSKGLAFKHTFIVDMHHQIRGRARPRGTYLHAVHGLQIVGRWPPGFHRVWQTTETVSQAEGIRLLYVAMTRARDRLVFVGAWPAELRQNGKPRMALDYLAHRRPCVGNPWDLTGALKPDHSLVHEAILWRFIGKTQASHSKTVPPEGVEDVFFRGIPERRLEWAQRTNKQPWTGAPSSTKRAGSPSRHGLSKDDAMRVGTAIHALIERIEDHETATESLSPVNLERALYDSYDGRGVGKRALQRASDLMEAFKVGTLLQRLIDVDVLAQEVPMLLEGGASGPAGAWVGAIDLLYRDPSTGRVIVADYKTDALESKDTAEAALRHSEQGRIYVDAVRQAMCLDYTPDFEVWFIETDQRVTVAL